MLLMSDLLHEAELHVKAEEYRITSSEISQNNPSHHAKAESRKPNSIAFYS